VILQGKTILISGVGPGLGSACAAVALRDGANVAVTARNGERLAATAAELDPGGERSLATTADLTDPQSLKAAVDAAVLRFGQLDGVVSVAADDRGMGAIGDVDNERFAAMLATNVIGTANLVTAAAPALEAAGGGSVVIIGSQASLRPVKALPQGAYGASKAAMLAGARDMAEDLGPKGIRVNSVLPTWMWGPMVKMYCEWQASERGISATEVKAEIASTMALREMPEDDDVAEAVAFLLSDRARMITGQRLLVNAGEFYDT